MRQVAEERNVEGVLEKLRERDSFLAENWDRLRPFMREAKCVREFLDNVSILRPEDEYDFKAEKISLMTLHAAKGLEFPVVFIVGCEDGLTPLDLELFKTDPNEERRLFYVGMTRAKKRLYFTRAVRRRLYGKKLELLPSLFLTDIAEELKRYEERRMKRKPLRQEDQLRLF